MIEERFIPQQGFPEAPARAATAAKPARKSSDKTLEQFLKSWAEHIRREQEKVHKLCEMSVTIHRRDRGLTLSDQAGTFGVQPTTQGYWLDYDPSSVGEIHPINIVGPAINTNQNACLQSNSVTEIQAANQSAKSKQAAMRWKKVSDYFERRCWNEAERAFIFDAVQKDGTILVYSYTKRVDEMEAAATTERKGSVAMFQCECGESGIVELPESPTEQVGEIPCPKCGGAAPAMFEPADGFDLEQANVPVFEICDELIPFYNFTIDTYGAKVGGIQAAKWLQVQRLVDQVDLEMRYPGREFGSALNWCYPLRCDYALANGAWEYLNSAAYRAQNLEFEKYEERTIYLHKSAYETWISPEDYEFVSRKGEQTFRIKEGQTISEAYQEMYGEDPEGLKFVWIDEQLVDIASPDECPVNFRKCFSDIHWRRVSGSYLSSPNYSLVTIQDDITLLNTMNHQIIARNAVNPVWYDSTIFEKDDLSQEFVPSKNAALLDDIDIRKHVTQLPVPTPSPHLGNHLQFLWSIKDDVSNVTPALRGDSQSGETLGAVRQQLEQSYGSLTSVLKSFALCKNNVFKQKAEMCKKVWTVEQFQAVGSMFGEPWSEEDVAEMIDIDLDTDLIISYKMGSEMPASNLDRELRFQQGLTALTNFISAAQIPLPPDRFQKILEKIDEQAGFDFDLSGLEVNDLVAQKRFLELATICAEYADTSFEEAEATKQEAVGIHPQSGMPITRMDLIKEEIFAQATSLTFSQYEDLDTQRVFFIEQLRLEFGKTKPNWVLLEMLNQVVSMIEMAQQGLAMEQMMADPQMQLQLAQGEAEDAKAAENQEREDADKQAERELREKESAQSNEQAGMQQAVGIAQQMAAQEHEAKMMAAKSE